MSMVRVIAGLFLVSSLSNAALADSVWAQRLASQLAQAETMRAHYGYKQTINNEDGERVAVFDPTASPPWELLSINGVAATDKEKQKFLSQREKSESRERSIEEMVSADSLKVIEETASRVVLSFTPVLDDIPEDEIEAIEGIATMDAVTGQLQSLTIRSKEPFSPVFAVKIESMNMAFDFQALDGVTLMAMSRFALKGKIAAVKALDESGTVTLSEIRRVID